ncbi:MAG: flagellar hook-associated protein FlgL [Candidatus Obscuribacterales bacterium]|nr:flagellar hook-associated protein FlgL [Steroidobacteraceae bacterium]
MRISTAAVHREAIKGILDQQTQLARTQDQVASGKRILTPADDPVSAVHILELDRVRAELDQYGRNARTAVARLNVEEQALADSGLLLQRVRELAIQANNASTAQSDREAIATELASRVQELMDIANRTDGSGEFVFSGFATKTQPFMRGASAVNYAGDQGGRQLQIAATQRIADSHSGFAAFMNIIEGNGTFDTAVNAANTGTGVIDVGTVANAAAWVRDTYTLTFTTPTTWQVVNGAAVVVGAGAYTSGSAITFNGAQISISGTPAAGDNFTIAASQKEDLFTTLDDLIATLRMGAATPATRAQFATRMSGAIAQLDQGEQHLLNVRAEVGARLSTIDGTQAAHDALSVELDRSLSGLRDLDYAEAISRMDRQVLGLQAAQQSYAKISRLSLFDYL